jgi:hypothetical protein
VGTVLSVPFGITGMAIGVTTGYALETIVRLVITRGELSAPLHSLWPYRSMAALAAAYAAGFATARLADSAIAGLPGLAIALAAGTATFGGLFILLGGVLERDRLELRSLRRRLRPAGGLKAEAAG